MSGVDKEKLIQLCQKYNIVYLALFGSHARGDETKESDIDLLARFDPEISLLEHVRIQREISEALGRKVDLLTEGSVHPYLKDSIYEDLVVLYGKAG